MAQYSFYCNFTSSTLNNFIIMILTKQKILAEIEKRNILIEPFEEKFLGPNSYELHLGRYLLVYPRRVLDAREHNEVEEIQITVKGHVLQPGIIYLGVSEEYVECRLHVPLIFSNTSAGRLGIFVNPSAGAIGHHNTWTLEISVAQPVRVYKGMPVANLLFYPVDGSIDFQYHQMKNAKYTTRTVKPVESMMWKHDF